MNLLGHPVISHPEGNLRHMQWYCRDQKGTIGGNYKESTHKGEKANGMKPNYIW